MTEDRAPELTAILSKAASIENIAGWLIATSICKDQQSFAWFMKYAADRIFVDEKFKLLGEIVGSLPDPAVIYDDFLTDLRLINKARVRVAHSVYLPFSTSEQSGPGHVMFKKGLPDSISDDEMRAQVAEALARVPTVMDALAVIGEAAKLLDEELRDSPQLPYRTRRKTHWRTTMIDGEPYL